MISLMGFPLAASSALTTRGNGPGNSTPDDPIPTDPYTFYGTDNGDKYAICIGISDYEGRRNDLSFCDDDAIAWKDYFVSQGYYVMLILDMQATIDNLEQAFIDMNALENAATDQVVFTYSGHGGWYDDNYKSCLISADLTWVTNGWVASMFDSYDSQNMYFFIDACESGYFATALDKPGRVICVGSGGLGYYTYDDPTTSHGIFSYYAIYAATNLYNYFEAVSDYAMTNFIDWCLARGATADPQYTDSFAGNLYI